MGKGCRNYSCKSDAQNAGKDPLAKGVMGSERDILLGKGSKSSLPETVAFCFRETLSRNRAKIHRHHSTQEP